VHFVHTSMAKNKRQAYAVSVGAGHQVRAEKRKEKRQAAASASCGIRRMRNGVRSAYACWRRWMWSRFDEPWRAVAAVTLTSPFLCRRSPSLVFVVCLCVLPLSLFSSTPLILGELVALLPVSPVCRAVVPRAPDRPLSVTCAARDACSRPPRSGEKHSGNTCFQQ
jgi:hypothetical protein